MVDVGSSGDRKFSLGKCDALASVSNVPTGAQPVKGDTSKDLVVTFTAPGAYGFKCTPHYAMGMVALVVVGDVHPANLDAVKAVHIPNKVEQRFDAIYGDLAKLN